MSKYLLVISVVLHVSLLYFTVGTCNSGLVEGIGGYEIATINTTNVRYLDAKMSILQ